MNHSKLTSARLVAAGVAVLLTLLVGGDAHAALVPVGTTEVRITAQRLDDGRTEFALQERRADGGWGERLLPRLRFAPASATVGRWLSSSELTVRAPGTDSGARAELRIVAQRIDDDRLEFALQERGAGGIWGERVLPRKRLFPSDPKVEQWLVASAIEVSLLESAPGVLVSEESFVSVSSGNSHFCGLTAGGEVVCRGNHSDGQATAPSGSFVSIGSGGGGSTPAACEPTAGSNAGAMTRGVRRRRRRAPSAPSRVGGSMPAR